MEARQKTVFQGGWLDRPRVDATSSAVLARAPVATTSYDVERWHVGAAPAQGEAQQPTKSTE